MDTHRLPKQALQYKPKRRRNVGDRGRDGGTNYILRIKEQETRLNLHEHDDHDDDDDASSWLSILFISMMHGQAKIR